MKTAARPIFVIGLNRSGTKWLSNELAQHPDVAAVLNEKTGIRETNMFRGFGRKFDLRKFDEFVGMIELWSTTDFFERTGVDKQRLFELDPLPLDPYALLGTLMSMFADQQGKKYWLQKGPPMAGLELVNKFPDALFVAIRRDIHDQISSHVKLSGNRSVLNLARATFSYVRDMRMLDLFCRRTGCPAVKYSELEKNKDALLAEVIQHLGLTPRPQNERLALVPNTSFQAGESRESFLSGFQRWWISALGVMLRCIPFFVMYWFARRSWNRRGPLVPGTFDNIHRQMPQLRERFRAQLGSP